MGGVQSLCNSLDRHFCYAAIVVPFMSLTHPHARAHTHTHTHTQASWFLVLGLLDRPRAGYTPRPNLRQKTPTPTLSAMVTSAPTLRVLLESGFTRGLRGVDTSPVPAQLEQQGNDNPAGRPLACP